VYITEVAYLLIGHQFSLYEGFYEFFRFFASKLAIFSVDSLVFVQVVEFEASCRHAAGT
jgi:hypothetical protein